MQFAAMEKWSGRGGGGGGGGYGGEQHGGTTNCDLVFQAAFFERRHQINPLRFPLFLFFSLAFETSIRVLFLFDLFRHFFARGAELTTKGKEMIKKAPGGGIYVLTFANFCNDLTQGQRMQTQTLRKPWIMIVAILVQNRNRNNITNNSTSTDSGGGNDSSESNSRDGSDGSNTSKGGCNSKNTTS